MNKLSAAAGLVGLLIAVLGAFMAIPGIDAGVAMVVLGIIAGLAYPEDRHVGLFLAVLLYPVAAAAVGGIPAVGGYLGTILGNIGMVAAGAAATALTMRVIGIVKANLAELGGKA